VRTAQDLAARFGGMTGIDSLSDRIATGLKDAEV